MIDPFDSEQIRYAAQTACMDMTRPHVLMRPKLFADGDQWCALYGDSLMEGVAGFGETPQAACYDFDLNWGQQRLRTLESSDE